MKFEQSMIRADEIIGEIEKGDITLEDSLKLYNECITELTNCRTQLNKAELQLTINS